MAADQVADACPFPAGWASGKTLSPIAPIARLPHLPPRRAPSAASAAQAHTRQPARAAENSSSHWAVQWQNTADSGLEWARGRFYFDSRTTIFPPPTLPLSLLHQRRSCRRRLGG